MSFGRISGSGTKHHRARAPCSVVETGTGSTEWSIVSMMAHKPHTKLRTMYANFARDID